MFGCEMCHKYVVINIKGLTFGNKSEQIQSYLKSCLLPPPSLLFQCGLLSRRERSCDGGSQPDHF